MQELEPPHGIEALHDQLHAGDVGDLGAVAVVAAGLLLHVVRVGPREKVAEDEGADVGIVLLVYHTGPRARSPRPSPAPPRRDIEERRPLLLRYALPRLPLQRDDSNLKCITTPTPVWYQWIFPEGVNLELR